MQIVFTTASRKHRFGRAHARHVVATAEPELVVTNRGEEGWKYVGADDRGVVLEVIAVESDAETLLVIHVMPHDFRGEIDD